MTAASVVEEARAGPEPRGWYLYAVLDDGAVDTETWLAVVSRVEGLTGVSAAGLRAVIGRVPEPFEALARALEELPGGGVRGGPTADERPPAERPPAELLENAARSHEDVVERLARCGPLLPVRLGTVLRDAQDARRLLERRSPDLHRQLADVGGRREWAVKVWLARDEAGRLAEGALGADAGTLGSGGPGRAYLAARRRSRVEAEALERACGAVGRAVAADLGGVARGTVRTGALGTAGAALAAMDEGDGPDDGWIRVLDGTFLLDPAQESDFFGRLDTALSRSPGLRADCSGPWPPYSFVRFGGVEDAGP